MPNTKEVEQEAEALFRLPDNPDSRSLKNIDVVINCRNAFKAGYHYALSNPLEQSEKKEPLKELAELSRDEVKEIMRLAKLEREGEQFEQFYDLITEQGKLMEYFFNARPLFFGEAIAIYQYLQSQNYKIPAFYPLNK